MQCMTRGEDFREFSHAKAIIREALADAFHREYGVEITKLRGQGYDGAATVSWCASDNSAHCS